MLEWSEEKKPDGKVSRYNHVTAEAGPILFTIEWKAWKENDSRTLTASWRDGGGELFLGSHVSTDMAKVAALAWLASIPLPQRVYPDDMTADMLFILGMPNFQCAPIAHALRRDGEIIATKAEAEQAHVLHWMIRLALDHPDDWRQRVGDRLKTNRGRSSGPHQ